jgi:hypothetical protein
LAAETGYIWPGSEFGERLGSTTEAIGATDLIWALATYHFQKKRQNAGLRSMPLASVFEQREKMYRNPVLPLSWSRYSPNRATSPLRGRRADRRSLKVSTNLSGNLNQPNFFLFYLRTSVESA